MALERPLRVLMTTDSVGGVWDYSLQLASALAPHDVEFTLLVFGPPPTSDQRRAASRLPNLELVTASLKLEWMTDPEADLHQEDRLLRELEAWLVPDIVHVNGYANAAAGLKAPTVVVAHSCVSSWWLACRKEPPPDSWAGYEGRLRAGVGAADVVVAPTWSHLRAFEQSHGSPRRTAVIYNGRDRDAYHGGSKDPLVLAAGRLWDDSKNIGALLRTSQIAGFPLVVAGDGAPGHLPPNVTALGRVSAVELAGRMAGAAVFAAPARYEPFGLSVLEAALSECALILGDIPTLRELWDGAAIFIDPDDDFAIAGAVMDLLGNDRRARRAGQVARRRALRYDADVMGGAYLRLYRSLLSESANSQADTIAAA